MFRYFVSSLFLLFFSLQLSASKADWAVQLKTSGSITTKDIALDKDGFSYVTGLFYDSIIVNTHNGSDTLIDKQFGETFFLKLDSCGNVIWAKQFVGQSRTEPRSIAVNSQGNVVLTGTFSADTDFDPSANTYIVNPEGGSAIYIAILDSDGELINLGRLGGSPGMYTPSVALDDSDNIYLAAAFSGGAPNDPVDVDPDLNNSFYLNPNGVDGVILKLDPTGSLDWVYQLRSSGTQVFGGDICANSTGVSATFRFSGQVTFDTDAGTKSLQSGLGKSDALVINLSSSKQFLGYSHLISTENVITQSIKPAKNGNLYLTGYFKDSLLLTLNKQQLVLESDGDYDSFVSRWSSKGDLVWIQQLSSTEPVKLWSIDVADNGNIYLSGNFQDTLSFGQAPASNQLISKNKNSHFLAVLNSDGDLIRTEKLNIESNLQNQIAVDSNGSIYGFSTFNNAFFESYDGDTTFSKIGAENALLFKLSNEANRIHLGNDKSICLGDSLLLKPDLIAGDEVLWSTGETTPTLSVKVAGTYHVKVSNCGRVFRDTITIKTVSKPTVSLGADTSFCGKVDFLIEPSTTNANSYVWNTNDTTKNLLVSQAGEYILKAKNGPDCVVSDTINVELIPVPQVFSFSDTVLCGLEEFTLDAGNSGSSYLWSTGETTQKITVTSDGVYLVEVSNSFCSAKDSVDVAFVALEECLPLVKIPNVFTPNNDGINDFFTLELKNIIDTELRIYNRWGELVFRSNSENIQWDGRSQGQELPEGNYFVVLQYSYSEWDKPEVYIKQLKGTVTLLR